MKLSLYNKKRNFAKTPEPKGKVSHQEKNLYIIQKHAASHLHYDFRLELNGVLLSWAVPKGPCLDPSVKRLAMHVEDHPVEYGSFEGIIPKGEYGGGTVMLWDKGKWYCEDENPLAAYHKGHLSFTLKAKKLNGRWSLIKFKKDDDRSWFLIKSRDKFARSLTDYDITKEKPNSVLTQQSMDEIAENYKHIWGKKGLQKPSREKNAIIKKKPIKIPIDLPKATFPTVISPQLATLVNKPPKSNDWLHEIKFDGYRIIAFKKGKKVKLMSRNNREWTSYFSDIAKSIQQLPVENAIFDGEVVLLDKKQHSNFQLLQNSIKAKEKKPFIYYIFDLIYYDKFNLMKLPLLERKNILKNIIPSVTGILRYSDHVVGSGEKVFKSSCKLNLEGIIAKLANSPYEQKRNKNWLKLKCTKRQEFVIGGYTKPQGKREYFGSLFLGVFNAKKELVYCGNVGTGFNQDSLKSIFQKLKKYQTTKNPFNSHPPGITSAVWVKPILVAEIEFIEWTREGSLRHPSFKGLRSDKPAKNIVKEVEMPIKKIAIKQQSAQKINAFPFKLTHPQKILFPEDKITKLDLANYYDEIHTWILPYIINRPLTLVRCPEGYKNCFYQKHINKTTSKVLYGIPIKEKNSTEKCIYIKDIDGLMALVQLGTLEIHPWGCTINNIESPDFITFDLDPAPDVPWKKVVATALLFKKHLADFKLKSFVKTTGGKGLHVVVPIKPEYSWEEVKNFSHVFVKFMLMTYPNQYVSEMSKAKRKGKIFLDYLRNLRGATAVSAYSTRARIHAPVSTPLDWDELTNNFNDTFFTLSNLPQRLKTLRKDPWKDFFKTKQSLRLDKIKL